MSPPDPGAGLPPALSAWVEQVTLAPVVRAERHFAGASREAWRVDGAAGGAAPGALFLLRDKRANGGSGRDAAVLRALAGTSVPVPAVVAYDADHGVLLLERLAGGSDFPAIEDPAEREATAGHLMALTAALHALAPDALDVPHLGPPPAPADAARAQLAQARAAVEPLGDAADPLLGFALRWLERNAPRDGPRCALIHSDMGPGNFLFEAGRVTGIVDWEVAHFGDPMEDLAAIAVRDMATPIGDLGRRLAEYEAAGGAAIDLPRIGFYRLLILVRNSAMIGAGLVDPPPGFDVVEMTMFQTLLMRAAALVFCDVLGVERPVASAEATRAGAAEESAEGADGAAGGIDAARGRLLSALARDLEQVILPALEEPLARRRSEGIARALATLEHEVRVGAALDGEEDEELAALCGQRPAGPAEREGLLRTWLEAVDPADAKAVGRAAAYLARRLDRLAERRRPLMGALHDRRPQPLPSRWPAAAREGRRA